jgi:undecaprenyl-diphosphatase
MHLFQIVVLAVIQGMAELLPISSSAHVIFVQRLMGLDPSSPQMTFLLVMLHTGTMFAVLVYFWPRWKPILFPAGRAGGSGSFAGGGLEFLKQIILATAVTGILGLALKVIIERVVLLGVFGHPQAEVEDLFRNLPLMAASLLAVGVLIIAAGAGEGDSKRSVVGTWQSVVIGAIQGICLPFRGFSRSGATISIALFCGIRRELAEDFSFALAVLLTPPVILIELRRLLKASALSGATLAQVTLPGMLGMVFSFLAGLVALGWLSAWLERGRWHYFGYYCIVFSVVVLLGYWLGL